ncbi:MAG: BatA domain-containing protein, partial [Planctomycetia bacterium]
MGGLFGGFVNPLLALGALAAALPLIIHLLNRQRHKRVAWAAMRFVEAAY